MNKLEYKDVSREFLYDLYITKNMTYREIAKKIGLTKKQVLRLVHKFKIKKKNFFKDRNRYRNVLTKDFLYQRYIIDDCSMREICKETGIAGATISKYLLLYNIERKHIGTKKQYENMKRKDKHICKPRPKSTDIKIGHKYGLLTVIGYDKNNLVCQCSCGNKKILHSSRIRNEQVKSCGCLNRVRGLDNKKCKTYKDIPYTVYKKCVINANDRNIPFNISIQELASQYEKQNKKCAISGVDIAFYDERAKTRLASSASLDRIDSFKPYEKGNVQWVHKVVQQMKWTSDQKKFIDWCKLIAQNNS